jgi:Ala-tRNA(Pro) deacylase
MKFIAEGIFMLAPKLRNYLDQQKVWYRTINHTPAYTAPEIAALAHVPGKELAKTVIVKIDGKLAMFVEPANIKINLKEFQKFLGAKKVELASEYEFEDRFPECETGAMPPFGNLYDMDVYVEDTLTEDEHIAFNGGSHSDLIEMSYKDFAKLVKPKVIHLH